MATQTPDRTDTGRSPDFSYCAKHRCEYVVATGHVEYDCPGCWAEHQRARELLEERMLVEANRKFFEKMGLEEPKRVPSYRKERTLYILSMCLCALLTASAVYSLYRLFHH